MRAMLVMLGPSSQPPDRPAPSPPRAGEPAPELQYSAGVGEEDPSDLWQASSLVRSFVRSFFDSFVS